ncbi:MAG: hypothetical protein Q7S22_05680 [Candidatus Micrarchaeota archaeon]|nr:hypothetical protein [Candidatus Micrarchaeota archaeon]
MVDIAIYGWVIFIMGFIMTIFLALTYMAAKLTQSNELEAYFNIELQEVFVSLLIVIFSIAFLESSNFIASTVASDIVGGGSSQSAIDIAIGYIYQIRESTQNAITDVFRAQVCLSVLSTFQRRIGEYVLTLSYKLFPGIDSLVSITNVVGYGLIAVYGSLTAQSTIFVIIDAILLPFVFPAGIILRFFPPTRQAGIFLIAIAIGFQSVFPLTYILSMQVYNDQLMGFPKPDQIYSGKTFDVTMLCGGQWVLFGVLGNNQNPLGRIPIIAPFVKFLFSEFGVNIIATPAFFFPIIESLGALSIPSLFIPALSATITLAFINAFMKFLSGKSS